MHTFLRSIGFSKKNNQQELEELIKNTVLHADKVTRINNPMGGIYVEYKKEYGENVGIIVRGEENDDKEFHAGHFFPYLKSTTEGVLENDIFIHKKIDSDAYTGMCDDSRLGVSLIFYIQNVVGNINRDENKKMLPVGKVKLTSLAQTGKIILPTQKRVYSHIASKIDNAVKKELIESVKKGNTDAMNYLAGSEMDKNVAASERIKKEDLFSIVENTFIPYGSESDLYTVLGNIVSSRQLANKETGEMLWIIRMICNEVEFETVINTEDLMGIPFPGMRFRGVIWMQGEISFPDKE